MPEALERVLQLWQPVAGPGGLLLAYGGTREAFAKIAYEPKVFVDDPRLRTRDHQREYQSYSGVLRAAADWLRARPEFAYVHLVEFDHLPVVDELNPRLLERLAAEDADLLAHHLHRIDGSSHPHYLYHASNPQFHEWISSISCRADKRVVLSMLGTGSFWRRSCFDAAAAADEPFPTYFELYLPTVAHHLGFRVRPWNDQSAFIANLPRPDITIVNARKAGAWTVHPVKDVTTDVLSELPQHAPDSASRVQSPRRVRVQADDAKPLER
jgi:hypothetical protein